jgi:hypothetical protein
MHRERMKLVVSLSGMGFSGGDDIHHAPESGIRPYTFRSSQSPAPFMTWYSPVYGHRSIIFIALAEARATHLTNFRKRINAALRRNHRMGQMHAACGYDK